MLSTAIVVFREMLEMALVIGIVLTATRGLAGRMLWIAGGGAIGVVGASLVAVFTQTISNWASGLGQELLNACILFTAAVVIGWTTLWMRKHFRNMTSHLKKVGQEVAHGALPLYSLSLAIGLAVFREGSEIILFVYGMAISGQSLLSIVAGSLIGGLLGTMAGVLLYFGLLRMSSKYMFQITNGLLVLLVAGLAAQGAAFLSAAGYFSGYAGAMWDSSWLISDASIAGKALHALIGYSARPMMIQGIFYLATLAGLVGIIVWMEFDHKRKSMTVRTLVTAAIFLFCAVMKVGQAMAMDSVYSPIVHEGEMEIEYSGNRTFDPQHEKNNLQSHEVEIEYGVNSRWATGMVGGFEKEPDESFTMNDLEWKNIVQFAEQGKNWLDSGAILSYHHSLEDGSPEAIEVKLLLEKEWGKFLHRSNLGLEQDIGHHATGGPDRNFNWSSRYRYSVYFEPGFEIQSDFGKANKTHGFQEQAHYIGPAIYGQFGRTLKYEAAYLEGVSDAAARSAGMFKLEYERFF